MTGVEIRPRAGPERAFCRRRHGLCAPTQSPPSPRVKKPAAGVLSRTGLSGKVAVQVAPAIDATGGALWTRPLPTRVTEIDPGASKPLVRRRERHGRQCHDTTRRRSSGAGAFIFDPPPTAGAADFLVVPLMGPCRAATTRRGPRSLLMVSSPPAFGETVDRCPRRLGHFCVPGNSS
jgi:hypothetical protein